MRNYVNLDQWRGPRDASPLDPADMAFQAKPAKSCRGCLFSGQYADVCQLAGRVAQMRQMPDCEDGFIFVAVASDERQLPLIAEVRA
jgi:hypothetical protein